MDTDRLNTMPSSGDAETVYDVSNELDGNTVPDAWVRR